MDTDTSDDELQRHCRKVAGRLLAKYRWRLLDHEEFICRCIVAAKEHPTADLAYIAFGVYNQALYNACCGSEGLFQWERGYLELHEMLCEQARHRYPDVWEDAVQSALLLIATHLERCVVPQAFFQFAWGNLRNAVRSLRRKAHPSDLSLERTVGDDDLALADSLPDSSGPIEAPILDQERRSQLHTALDEFELRHPRKRNQLAAVRMKYLDGKDDEAISQMLGVSVKRVYELRSLGLKKLREDPSLRGLLDDQHD